jgi:hypothetical protein
MSAPQNKKSNQNKSSNAAFDSRRNYKAREKKLVNTKVAMSATVIVIAVLLVFSLFINSALIRQTFTAADIGGVKYTINDYNYYFQNIYIQYYNAMSSSGLSSMLPSKNKPLKSQMYDETKTWEDFFDEAALSQLTEDTKILIEAQKANFTLPAEEKALIDSDMESLRQNVLAGGFKSLEHYLKQAYGKGMNEKIYREKLERSYLINAYAKHVNDSFTYTQEQLEGYYSEHKDKLDTFTYRYFLVEAAEVNETDYADDAAYQAAKDAAIAEATAKAEEYANRIKDEESFIAVAREYDAEQYAEDDSTERAYRGELLGADYGDWLKDAARKPNDVTTAKTTSGCYVVLFEDRSDNHYATANIRYLLVRPELVTQAEYGEDQEAFNDALQKANEAASQQAYKIYDEWVAAGATEEKLQAEVELYAGATEGPTTESQLLENVYKSQMTKDVDHWIYDSARKAGDYTLLYVEDVGYYLVYYVGVGKVYSDLQAENGKRSEDFNAWKEGLTVSDPKTTWLLILAL